MSETCFRIFNENYIDIDVLAFNDVSSEQTAFPVLNAYNLQRRTKVYRSAGYFNVTSSNNTIIFEETNTVNLTATIAVAEYATDATFLTAIKTALEAAGVSTYTVTRENLKIKIVSNGVGGGGVFNLILTSGSFTAEDLLGMDNSADKTGSLTIYSDFVVVHYPDEWILWDMGVATNPDAFIMTDSRNDTFKISPDSVIKLEANETDAFDSPSFSTTITYDENMMSHLTESGIGDQEYRYWRLQIEDQANGEGHIQIGALFLGNYLKPPRGRAQFALTNNYVDRSRVIYSEGGQDFVDELEQTAKFSIVYKGLQKADVENFDYFFGQVGVAKPFFVSMDSCAVFSTNANRRIIFCKFDSAPSWSIVSPDNFSLTLSFREAL